MLPQLAAAGVNAIGSGISGYFAAKAAKTAARQQNRMQRQAIEQQNLTTDRVEDLFSGYTDTGGQANAMLANATGLNGAEGAQDARNAFYTDPGYEWQQQQAMDAVQRQAAAGGGSVGGSALSALQTTSQGMAQGQYGDWVRRLGGMAGQGLQATGGVANAAVGAGNNISNAYNNMGNNTAQGTIGATNAMTAAMSGIGQAAGNYAGYNKVDPVQQPQQQQVAQATTPQQYAQNIQPAGGQNQMTQVGQPQASYRY